ncbi:MAG: flippase [Patescibacteria group bacterium]|nr:flippase [Patescibacteria group bacterium]
MSRQHIVRSVFWLTVSEIIFNISGYIVHSGVGRILGPADYGRYGLVITLTTMIIVLIGNGIPTAMSKYLSEIFETRPEMVRVIKKQTLLLQIILISLVTLVFFALAPLIAKALGDTTLTSLFRLSSLIIPAFAAASFYFYYFTGIHRFNIQAILKTVRSIAKVIFIIGLAYFFKVEGSIAGYIAAPFLVFLIALGIDRFHTFSIEKKGLGGFFSFLPLWKRGIKGDLKRLDYSKVSQSTRVKNPSLTLPFKKGENKSFNWKRLLNYAWPITLFMLFYEIMISIDLYMVKALLHNDYLTGIYNGALTVGRIPYYLFYALTIVLLPTISKTTSQNQTKETAKIINQTIRLLLLFLFPGVVLMAIFAKPIITLFYGCDYIQAVYPMQILVFGVGFLTIFYVLSFALNGAGKVKAPMWIAFFGAVLNSFLNYFLITRFALTGAAVSTTITSLFTMIAAFYLIKKHFGVSIKTKGIAKISLATLALYIASFYFPDPNYLFVIWALILFLFYGLILYILGELKRSDINLLLSAIRKNKKS